MWCDAPQDSNNRSARAREGPRRAAGAPGSGRTGWLRCRAPRLRVPLQAASAGSAPGCRTSTAPRRVRGGAACREHFRVGRGVQGRCRSPGPTARWERAEARAPGCARSRSAHRVTGSRLRAQATRAGSSRSCERLRGARTPRCSPSTASVSPRGIGLGARCDRTRAAPGPCSSGQRRPVRRRRRLARPRLRGRAAERCLRTVEQLARYGDTSERSRWDRRASCGPRQGTPS